MTARIGSHERFWTRSARSAVLAVALVVSLLTVVGSATNAPPADAAAGGQASRYVSISPERVLDTRDPGFGPLPALGILSVNPLVPERCRRATSDGSMK